MPSDAFLRTAVTGALIVASIATQSPSASAVTANCRNHEPRLVGTDHNDVLRGTSGRDVIEGRGGSDVIRGLGGQDVLCGGGGRDRILGGEAPDIIFGYGGDDTLEGNGRNDVVEGGDGDDKVYGGENGCACNEYLAGGAGNDEIFGGPGADLIWGDSENVDSDYPRESDAGDGDDFLDFGDGHEWDAIMGDLNGNLEVDLPAGTMTGSGSDRFTEVHNVYRAYSVIGTTASNTITRATGLREAREMTSCSILATSLEVRATTSSTLRGVPIR